MLCVSGASLCRATRKAFKLLLNRLLAMERDRVTEGVLDPEQLGSRSIIDIRFLEPALHECRDHAFILSRNYLRLRTAFTLSAS
jgi:hypothetical protein